MFGCTPGAQSSVLNAAWILPDASRSKGLTPAGTISSFSHGGGFQSPIAPTLCTTHVIDLTSRPHSSSRMPRAHTPADVDQACSPTRRPLRSDGERMPDLLLIYI